MGQPKPQNDLGNRLRTSVVVPNDMACLVHARKETLKKARSTLNPILRGYSFFL